jgi:hypothetical protein
MKPWEVLVCPALEHQTLACEDTTLRDLRNRGWALPHCWGRRRLLESEQGSLRPEIACLN